MIERIQANQITISRLLNVLALFALLLVLSGSLFLQFGIGEQPCPLCLVQRSAMIGLAVGPMLNLLTGIKARNYALAILAAAAGSAGSIRQILLHISTPGDPGYGPSVLGLHLYTWALVTFIIAIVGCALLLMWSGPLLAGDTGVHHGPGFMRALVWTSITWVTIDLLLITIWVIPECGIGMCPDDPANLAGLGVGGGIALILGQIVASIAIGFTIDRKILPKD